MMYYNGFGSVGMFFMAAFWIGFVLLIVWLIRQGIKATHNGNSCCDHNGNSCCGHNGNRKSHNS